MPTQIISAFLSTGRDNDTDFLNFLKALGTPVIIADTPRAKKRIALTNAIGRPNEKIRNHAKNYGIDVSKIMDNAVEKGVKFFKGYDDAHIIENTITYAYELSPILEQNTHLNTDNIIEYVQYAADQFGYLGRSNSPVVVNVSIVDNLPRDGRQHFVAIDKPFGGASIVMDIPNDNYVDVMVERYSSYRNNDFMSHAVSPVYYVSTGRKTEENSDAILSIGFSPIVKWGNKITEFTEKLNNGKKEEEHIKVVPHILKNNKMWAISANVPDDMLEEYMQLCVDVFGDNIYNADNAPVGLFNSKSKKWRSHVPIFGERNGVLVQAKVMSDVRKATGLDFDSFNVSISPALYNVKNNPGRGNVMWDIEVDFDEEIPGMIFIGYNDFTPLVKSE